MPRLRAENAIVEATIDDNVLLTPKAIAQIEKRYQTLDYPNARDNPEFQREYLLKASAQTDFRIIPEFRPDIHVYSGPVWEPMTNPITGDETDQFIGFISCDHGVVDQSATIAGVLNWQNSTLYIMKEYAANGMSLSDLAAVHNEFLAFLAPRCGDVISIGDLFEQCRVTMSRDHGINFQRPRKSGLEDNCGVTRTAFSNDKIKVHYSCKKIISQLNYGLWAETTSTNPTRQFARSGDSHNDFLAALIYLVRRVIWNQRPIIRQPRNPRQNPRGLL
jgi:hypothetical protein